MEFHQLRSAQNATDVSGKGGTINSKLLSGLVSGMDFGAGEFNSNIDNMIAGLHSRDAEIELILNNLSVSNELPVPDKGFVETVGDFLFDDIKPLADVKNHAKETYLNQGAKALEEGRTVDYYANLAGFVASEFAATTPFEIGMSLFGGVFGMVGKAKNVDAVLDIVPDSSAPLPARDRILANISESKAARESSNFDSFIQNEGRLQESLDIWPPNAGRIGPVETIELQPGFVMDRFGQPSGSYLAPQTTPFTQRALPSYMESDVPYYMYEVVKPIPKVIQSRSLPWFGQRGMGTQFELPKGINYLDPKNGYVKVRHYEP